MNILDQLWRALPSERGNLRPYVERAKAYRNECGCSTGAVFFGASLLVLVVRGVFFHFAANGGSLSAIFGATLLVFGAAIVGKAVGIGVARIRLLLLYRDLHIRYRLVGG
jgi:hypothetical protein